MLCKNKITVAHYNNGKTVIEGSSEIMIPRIKKYNLDLSINGYYTHEVCNGKIVASLFTEDTGINIHFWCDRCGITRNDIDFSIEKLEQHISDLI